MLDAALRILTTVPFLSVKGPLNVATLVQPEVARV